jgi:hypothetical protein
MPPSGSFLVAVEPILDPRQKRGNNKKAELPAACKENVNSAANRQEDADGDDPLPAAKILKDGSVSG